MEEPFLVQIKANFRAQKICLPTRPAGWIPIAQTQGHLTGHLGGAKELLLLLLCQLPIPKSQYTNSLLMKPVQRCPGTRRGKASWQLCGQPMERPAHLLYTASLMPVVDGPVAHPSGLGANHQVLRASWQAGKAGQQTHLLAGTRLTCRGTVPRDPGVPTCLEFQGIRDPESPLSAVHHPS